MQIFNVSASIRRIVDVAEQFFLIGLYIWFLLRFLPEEFPPQELYTSLILLSEGVVLVFIICRHRTEKISLSIRDWIIALAGTMTPMLVDKGGELFLPTTGVTFIFIGFMIHFGAKLSLRRSFGIVPADRGIKCNGLYSFIRHPMYFGYSITHMGFLLAAPSIWNFTIYCFTWIFLVTRIIYEERLLSENPEYIEYRQRVHYRLIPKLF
ncbi:isoprenylcysteine carboxylmethyltransferase family protein [uncultured Photobacterium sp.]|uniref:methyltransferase family protein n=1 Tax=uncultured Photobacterium sp. TaxID=173973 RepID=UPI00260BD375|nr:isoprenylcysteine carboxylmethyltransferase family protein [uncultured Photobacterium sp.]